MPGPHERDTVEYPIFDTRAARYFEGAPPPVTVRLGACSHPGKSRDNNEDHFLVARRRRVRDVLLTNLPDGWLSEKEDVAYAIAVADGIGGAAFGELASRLALQTAWDLGLDEIKWTFRVNEREASELMDKFEVFARMIDQALIARGRVQPEMAGMGTTMTAAYTVGPEAFLAHVGDSRAYLWRGGSLLRLTRDHTVAQQHLDAGLPVPSNSSRHMLTNCLGGGDEGVQVDVHHLRLHDGDALLLCTDGLTDMVPEEQVAAAIRRHEDPPEACRILVEAALESGGKDNVTVVLARYTLPNEGPLAPETVG